MKIAYLKLILCLVLPTAYEPRLANGYIYSSRVGERLGVGLSYVLALFAMYC